MVVSHVCTLQERFDPSLKTKLWVLPRKDVCLCQIVVAPKISVGRTCPKRTDATVIEDFWLTDDYTLITLLTNRKNWTPAKLDHLLGRSYCCKF